MPALTRYLDKRLYDSRRYDIDMSDLLDDDETVLWVKEIEADDSTVSFGEPIVNTAPMLYPALARRAEIGKVVQVQISGGTLPIGATEACTTIRVRIATSINPQLEAAVTLRLTGAP